LVVAALTPATAAIPEPARAALLKGDWAQVIAVLEKSGPNEPDAVCRLVAAHACLATNRTNEALILFLASKDSDWASWKSWTAALSGENPCNAIASYLYGDALARSGDPRQAEDRFSAGLKLDPELGLALVARGTLKALAGRTDDAYVDLMRATQLQPGLADAHASLGCLEIILQNAEGAEDAFNEALKTDPSFALAYNGRGCARYGLGKPDEAALDFEMASTLCPALALTDANQEYVLAMVARKVDEKVPAVRRPGTTLETRQTLVIDFPGIWSQGLGRPERWAPFLLNGEDYERFNIRHDGARGLVDEPGHTIVLPENASPEVKRQYLKPLFDAIGAGKQVYAKIDMNMGFLRYMFGGEDEFRWAGDAANVLAGNARADRPGIWIVDNAHSAGTDVVAEYTNLKLVDAVSLQSSRLGADAIANVAKTNPHLTVLLSTADGDFATGGRGMFSINEPNVAVVNLPFLQSVRPPEENPTWHLASGLLGPIPQMLDAQVTAHSNVADAMLLATRDVKIGDGEIQHVDGTLGDIARDFLQTGKIASESRPLPKASEPLTGLSFSSSQPWSQMPKFMDDVTSGMKLSGPVAVVAQDPVRSYAFVRMLQNKGISTVVTASLDEDQLQHLGSVIRPERIVGFDQKLDDNWRKIVPFFPDDHGGGGGAVASGTPVRVSQSTFSFPGSDGQTVTLPLPQSFAAPKTDWNQFKPWTPRGDVGGVDTRQLEWTFVDKGVWPVMTVFTLAYEPTTTARTDQEQRK
jgi:tetratricopeptide (TPR) repeat protein